MDIYREAVNGLDTIMQFMKCNTSIDKCNINTTGNQVQPDTDDIIFTKLYSDKFCASIESFCLKLIEDYDILTLEHTNNMVNIANNILKEFALDDNTIKTIRLGCIIHDIGKIFVPPSILLKVSPLTKAEKLLMYNHPTIGYELMIHFYEFLPKKSLEILLYHHEKNGGNGYPNKIKELPLHVEIASVSDMMAALQENRPYRQGMNVDLAIEEVFKYEWCNDITSILNNKPNCLLF